MKAAAYVGLWLSLMGGVALAQNAPTGTSQSSQAPQGGTTNPPAVQSGPSDNGGANAPMQRTPNEPNAQMQPTGPNASSGPDEQYEGEIIQTPNGTYVVSQPDGSGNGMSPQEERGDMDGQGPQGMGARPHPRHTPPMSKAAHFRIKGPDLALDVKCPDDESVKVCVDAAAQLIDKASAIHH